VSRLAGDLPELAELDLNPVIARPDGAVAVDARARLTPAPHHDPIIPLMPTQDAGDWARKPEAPPGSMTGLFGRQAYSGPCGRIAVSACCTATLCCAVNDREEGRDAWRLAH
jgi:ATP-grasp domain